MVDYAQQLFSTAYPDKDDPAGASSFLARLRDPAGLAQLACQ